MVCVHELSHVLNSKLELLCGDDRLAVDAIETIHAKVLNCNF